MPRAAQTRSGGPARLTERSTEDDCAHCGWKILNERYTRCPQCMTWIDGPAPDPPPPYLRAGDLGLLSWLRFLLTLTLLIDCLMLGSWWSTPEPVGPLVGLLFITLMTWLWLNFSLMTWTQQAQSNLPALGRTDCWWSPARSWCGFLIPGVNLILPCVVMSELARASGGADWKSEPMPGAVLHWWALTLVSGWLYLRLFLPWHENYLQVILLRLAIDVAWYLLTMRLIKMIAAKQEETFYNP